MPLVCHANHALLAVRCLTCEPDHDLVVWTIDQQWFISEAGPQALYAGDAKAAALMARYERLVQKQRGDLDVQYEPLEGWPEVDLSGLDVEILTDHFLAPPMAVLAAARGLRQAVAQRLGVQPLGVVLLGPYRCILSFDETPQAPYSYALHLSVGHAVLPPRANRRAPISLFFTRGEVPLLLAHPGQTVPSSTTTCRRVSRS